MWKRALAGIGCAGLVACGGSQPPKPSASPHQGAAPAPEARGPSAEIRRYTPSSNARFKLYANLQSLLGAEVVRRIVPQVLAMAGDAGIEAKPCLNAFSARARELSVVADAQAKLSVVTFVSGGAAEVKQACLGNVLPAHRIELKGSGEAYGTDSTAVALVGDTALIGTPSSIEAALAAPAAARDWPAELTLNGEQQLSWTSNDSASLEKPVAARGSLVLAPDHCRLGADVELPSEADAKEIEQNVQQGIRALRTQLQSSDHAEFGAVFDGFRLEREGRTLHAAFELRGGAESMARDWGVIAALAISGVKRYIVNAKLAEARSTIAQIASAYKTAFESTRPSQKHKALWALPKVPADVPSGVKYRSQPSEWAAWQSIGFSLSEPQYYQYEVVLAKDKKSAEVVARGDIDADGELSEFRLKLSLDPKAGSLTSSPPEEINPTE